MALDDISTQTFQRKPPAFSGAGAYVQVLLAKEIEELLSPTVLALSLFDFQSRQAPRHKARGVMVACAANHLPNMIPNRQQVLPTYRISPDEGGARPDFASLWSRR